MTIVGTAELLIVPNTKGFDEGLRKDVAESGSAATKDAEAVGSDIGGGYRRGVREETGKLGDDLEKDGAKAGDGLHKGLSGGLSKVSTLLGATGLPLGALTSGLDKAGESAEGMGRRASGLSSTLNDVGKVAFIGFGAAAVAAGAGALDVGEKMQSADASIAAASGTSVAAAEKIGSAFEGTAFKSEFSSVTMAKAYASVAGQLKETEGHALSAAEASKVMSAADDLATAKQIDLGTATQATAGIMQAFQLKAGDAAHVSDVLYRASTATGQGVDTLASSLEKVHSKLGEAGGSVGDLSGLLVDLTDRGVTGRAAMAALNTSMNTLEKSGTGVQQAIQSQKAAYDQLTPSLQNLADHYKEGKLTAKEFTAATQGLPAQQADLVTQFTTASKAVDTAQDKYKQLGVTVFDAQGKFVGMRDIIDQLHGRLAGMSQQQQLAAASTIFGAGAARQMLSVILAGPAAYDQATAAVNRQGQAHAAAAKQSATLKVELETLEAGAVDLAGKLGTVLIPIVTSVVGAFTKATVFVTDHKAALIALGAVVTGILGPAMAVFAVNKMAAFGKSFSDASSHVKSFASDVQGVVSKVTGLMQNQTSAAGEMSSKVGSSFDEVGTKAEGSATTVGTAASTVEGETSTMATDVEADNTAAGGSFEAMAAEADTAAAGVGTAEATITTEVTAADTTVETENAAAAGSFAAVDAAAAGAGGAGALGLAGLGAVAAPGALVLAAGALSTPDKNASQVTGAGGNTFFNPRVGDTLGETGTGGPLQSTASGLGLTLPSGNAQPGKPSSTAGHQPGMSTNFSTNFKSLDGSSISGLSSKVKMAKDALTATAATGSLLSQVAQFLGAAGFNKTAIAGIYGNAGQESSDNPNTPGGGMWQQISNFGQGTGGSLQNQMQVMLPQIESIKGTLNAAASPQAAALAFSNLFEKDEGTVPGAGPTTPNTSPVGNVAAREAYASQAYAQLGGIGIPAGSTAATTSSAKDAAREAAKKANTVAGDVAKETAQVNQEIGVLKASVGGGGAFLTTKGQAPGAGQQAITQATSEAADLKAALSIQVAQQKASLTTQTTAQKAELGKQTSDQSAASKQLNTLLTAVHSGNLKTLTADLNSTHNAALSKIESDLNHDHSSALASLDKQLVAVHAEALQKLAAAELAQQKADEATKAKAEAAAATTAAINASTMQAKVVADQAKASSDQIADSTKVYLDQQAAAGLSGAALTAANAQTSLDQVTAASNQAIDAQQVKVDQAANGSPLAQAQAGLGLANAQAAAQVQEAQAQSALDKATAVANAASTAASSTAPVAATAGAAGAAPAVTNNFQIFGNGSLTASDLFREVGWALTTGALPVAAPAPQPAAAAA